MMPFWVTFFFIRFSDTDRRRSKGKGNAIELEFGFSQFDIKQNTFAEYIGRARNYIHLCVNENAPVSSKVSPNNIFNESVGRESKFIFQ